MFQIDIYSPLWVIPVGRYSGVVVNCSSVTASVLFLKALSPLVATGVILDLSAFQAPHVTGKLRFTGSYEQIKDKTMGQIHF